MENRTNSETKNGNGSKNNKVVIAQILELVKQLQYDPADFKNYNWPSSVKNRPSMLHIEVRKIVLADVIVSILSGLKVSTGLKVLGNAENKVLELKASVIDQYRIPAEDGYNIHDIEGFYGTINERVPLKNEGGRIVNDYGYLEKGDQLQPHQAQ